MHVALHGVERVRVVRELVFGKAVNIVERIEIRGLPVMGTVNDSVFQIAVVIAFQVIVVQAKLLSAAKGDQGITQGDGDGCKADTGQTINICSIVKGDVVVLLCPETEHGNEDQYE